MAADSNEINDMTSETEATTVETSLDTTAAGAPAPAVATLEPVKATTGKLSAQDLIRAFEADQLRSDLPEIYVGDTVRVGVRDR
jgi:large subunit ribosomal protein L19